MNSISWNAFGVSDVIMGTVVHFFPASMHGAAPYPVRSKLTVFGKASAPESVVLDGARLQHPDGVAVDQIFPRVKEAGGPFGIRLEIEPPRQKMDVDASGCFVELVGRFSRLKYTPALDEGEDEAGAVSPAGGAVVPAAGGAMRGVERSAVLIKDAFQLPSIVLINLTDAAVDGKSLVSVGTINNGAAGETALHVPVLTPHEVREVTFDSPIVDKLRVQECSWGLARTGRVTVRGSRRVAAYLLYRSAEGKRIVSVSSI